MFSHQNTKSRKRRNSNSSNTFRKLEDRNLLAAISFNGTTGQLFIAGDAGNNTGAVAISNSNYVATVDDVSREVPTSRVNEVIFLGFGGNDTFTNNTSSAVTAYGHAGNDALHGGSGNDALIGGSGNDRIYGNDGNDRLVGANGNDVIHGGDGNDRIFGSAGTNTLNGNAGDDVMYGSDDGDDVMKGGEGKDWIFGLGGNDELHAGNGGSLEAGELLMGHEGNDKFFGGDGLNIFWGGNGNDVMVGGNGINRMHGQNGNDSLTGGASADLLKGNNGNDTIKGLGGNDTVDAGPGTGDVVQFTNSYASATVNASSAGQNVSVSGSNGSDRIAGGEWLEFSDRRIKSNQANLAAAETTSLNALNNYRSTSSRSILSTPSDLTTFAENWSRTMATNGLSHSSAASRRALLTDGRTTVGENVVQIPDTGQSAAAAAVAMHRAWVNSSTHRANMLNGNFSEVGIGIYRSGGFWWGTHVFAG